ncbi:hypothetical protein LB566_13860 [Mesorhizobium sp. CA13]|uniref:hypothetical protein n=1 Tax=Mesorhizobium sp. CA13 TaxID=2876643 RepID=UPI001CCB1713|nr:hypothetical protein [Mesorhizobium sp. CA13]MBZ9854890.1 hypothetical protein [Mesorhizobium sp. CA13]
MKGKFLFTILPLTVAGCGTYTPKEVADPKAITLNAAMIDVADSLNDMRARTRGRDNFGLIVDQVTVTFNVSSQATNTGKLAVTASNIPVAAGILGASAENTLVATGNRGNQIIITLKNLATADTSKATNKKLVDRCAVKHPPLDCINIANQPKKPGVTG